MQEFDEHVLIPNSVAIIFRDSVPLKKTSFTYMFINHSLQNMSNATAVGWTVRGKLWTGKFTNQTVVTSTTVNDIEHLFELSCMPFQSRVSVLQ